MKQENLTSCFMNVDFCYAKTAKVSVSMHLLLELMTLSLFYHNSAQRMCLRIVRGTETASLY